MARFKFSKRILTDDVQPNYKDINQINATFKRFLESGLNNENVSDESIRTRHMVQPGTAIAYVDCSDDLFNYGTTEGGTSVDHPGVHHGLIEAGHYGGFSIIKTADDEDDNKAKLWVRHDGRNPSPGKKLFEVTMIYHPYSSSARTEVAPAYQSVGSSAWVVMQDLKKAVGLKAGRSATGDVPPYRGFNMDYPTHPCLGGMATESKRKTGNPRTDCIQSVAHGAPVIINFQVGDKLVDGKPIEEVQAFGLAIFHNLDRDMHEPIPSDAVYPHTGDGPFSRIYFKSICTLHDKLIMMITARDVGV